MCDSIQLSPAKLTSLHCRACSSRWYRRLVDLPQMKSVVSYKVLRSNSIEPYVHLLPSNYNYTEKLRRFKARTLKNQLWARA